MATKKYQKITARTLEHVLAWGDHMSKLQSWNKSDTLTYLLIKQEVKRLRQEEYLRRQAIEQTPYLDPDVPYHMT